MIMFIINRMLWTIPVLWLVATVTFVLMHAAPGGPWDARSAGKQLDPALAASFNLNPEVDSLARFRAYRPWGNPQYWELFEKTAAAGVRQAGFPDE